MFLKSLFSPSPLKAFGPIIERINEYESTLRDLSDADLRARSLEVRGRVESGSVPVSDVRAEAFALVREAARRTLGQRHFDVQLAGGLALFEGSIVEMSTGEGKTLAATAPAYTHALTGKGVHVITVNDYLAQRDAVWMGQIYHFLGLSTACIIHDAAYAYDPAHTRDVIDAQSPALEQGSITLDKERDEKGGFLVKREFLRPISRREAYQADIVYGTNNEFGFDYLRDNLAYATAQQVQRGHAYAIIDEVDSILIDEARTPLIISAPDVEAAQYYKLFSSVVSRLIKDEDYEVDEKAKFVRITESGITKVEQILSIENLYDPQHVRLAHYLEESLKAYGLFFRDKQYVVKNGEIVIVDEFTGRLMYGRRYSGGLHQAIEAKEGVSVQQESKTFAQITIQNYFRLYERVSGMTGTAQTSSEEFNKVYGLNVVTIPTDKPRVRKDLPDLVYKNKDAKYAALVAQVQDCMHRGQPVLIGTTSIDENELLSARFNNEGMMHEVLNAKNHEREGEIIAQAGRPGRVTLATNMAGRGVDIILGGNPPDTLEGEQVRATGGLFVIGTQRNDSRRVDNQLRGRAGRQGDPGQTQFFLSLEDDLMRVFGGDRVKSLMTTLNLPDEVPIQSRLVEKVIDEAQKKVEGLNFDARKHLLDYDDVLNRQRKAMYRRRQHILEMIEQGKTVDVLQEMVLQYAQRLSAAYRQEERAQETAGADAPALPSLGARYAQEFSRIRLIKHDGDFSADDVIALEEGTLPDVLHRAIVQASADSQTGIRIIASLDMFWTSHLENLEALLEAVRMRAYGQRDPLVEYKRESYDMFKTLLDDAQQWVVSNVFVLSEAQLAAQQQVAAQVSGGSASGAVDPAHKDIGRNDPCWCGAKKPDGTPVKYKHCHGKNA